MSRIPVVIPICAVFLLILDVLAVIYPRKTHLLVKRWGEHINRFTRALNGKETRIVDEARHIRFIRILGICCVIFLSIGLWLMLQAR